MPGRKPLNICGQKFGRLVPIEIVGKTGTRTRWRCLCECGELHEATASSLRAGQVKSCGCLRSDVTALRNMASTKHGGAYSTEYKIWQGMHQRCYNPNSSSYERYGARGIVVCNRWHAFEHFYADMGPRPSRQQTLDRKDNNGPYGKDNCQWSTAKVQQNNRRNTVFIEYQGRSQPLTAWADELGLPAGRIAVRLRNGLPMHEVLQPDNIQVRGERAGPAKLSEADVITVRSLYADGLTMEAIASIVGVSESTIGHIINRKTWRHVA